jgi:hypothetical protein
MFTFVPLTNFDFSFFRKRSAADSDKGQKNMLNWVIIVLTGIPLLGFVFLLSFFWSAMRYLDDFVPSLILLGVIGFWQGYQLLLGKQKSTKLYAVIGIVLAVCSIVNSTLLATSVNDARFPIIDILSRLTK